MNIKISADEAFRTVKTALMQIEMLSDLIKSEPNISKDVKDLYRGSLTALRNMVPAAECAISNCNRAKQIILKSDSLDV